MSRNEWMSERKNEWMTKGEWTNGQTKFKTNWLPNITPFNQILLLASLPLTVNFLFCCFTFHLRVWRDRTDQDRSSMVGNFLSYWPQPIILHVIAWSVLIGICLAKPDVWRPTCNADSQRMFFARICRHVALLNRFQKLPTRCRTANIAKNRPQRGVTLERFFAQHRIIASWRCKLTNVTPAWNVKKTSRIVNG